MSARKKKAAKRLHPPPVIFLAYCDDGHVSGAVSSELVEKLGEGKRCAHVGCRLPRNVQRYELVKHSGLMAVAAAALMSSALLGFTSGKPGVQFRRSAMKRSAKPKGGAK